VSKKRKTENERKHSFTACIDLVLATVMSMVSHHLRFRGIHNRRLKGSSV